MIHYGLNKMQLASMHRIKLSYLLCLLIQLLTNVGSRTEASLYIALPSAL